jgi:2-keto-4-pentenoate hydratase/2-oxohepta-3-ene-1,7-dioic acid hydratase in catechol pathway
LKLISFRRSADERWRPGILHAEGAADLEVVGELAGFTGHGRPRLVSVRSALGLPRDALMALAQSLTVELDELWRRGAIHDLARIRLGPPVPDPEKIICLGLNYRDHAREAGLAPPSAPMFFAKFANSLVGPHDAIVPPRTTREVDYEAELAVVIGAPARNLDAAQAMDHVAGVMAFNDVSARDLQLANNLWTGGKAIDTFGPCGPALVTLDEVGDIQALGIATRVNGTTVQNGSTADMIFGVAETVAFLSQIMTLVPGDIIATGTPAGVGNSRRPKLFLQPGDTVEVEVQHIGVLTNLVAAAA